MLEASVNDTRLDDYDFAGEKERYAFDDVTIAGLSLNRGTASVHVVGGMEQGRLEAAKKAHLEAMLPSTLSPTSPVLELGYPAAGMYVMCGAGVYLDLYLGVAQKLFDENHPRLRRMVSRVERAGLLLRREINTDDFLAVRPGIEGIVTPQELSALYADAAKRTLGAPHGYRVFLSNSGTEAIECALKLAQLSAYKRLVREHGMAVLERLMAQLEIAKVPFFDGDADGPVFADYPFFSIACEGAFHGRTLGSLHLTRSKAAHQLGYAKSAWTRHIRFNGNPRELADLIDPRALQDVLAAPGGVRAALDQGRLPRDLIAAFVVEPYQGEGGYRMADAAWLKAVRRTCEEHRILFVADEIQSFCRTGTVLFSEQLGVVPDIIALAKAAVLGMTLAREDLTQNLHLGWHSNTWGGGKIFDVQWSHATLDTYLNFRDPLFGGRTYAENSALKGAYIRAKLDALASAHPDLVTDFSGIGGMWGISVRNRDQLIDAGWRRGIKLLGCGPGGDTSRLRLIFLTDVLTKEIDDFAATFARALDDARR
jgi:4-aminobutyrate aminotransferase-like enzyme